MTEEVIIRKGREEEREEPEWRRLVWALDMIEVVQADDIRQFAEPHKGID